MRLVCYIICLPVQLRVLKRSLLPQKLRIPLKQKTALLSTGPTAFFPVVFRSACLVLGVMYKGGQYQDGRQHQGTRQQQCGRQHQGGGGLQGGGGHQGDQLNNRVRQHQVCPKVVWRAQNAKLKGPTRNQDLLGPADFAVQNVFAFSDSGTMHNVHFG